MHYYVGEGGTPLAFKGMCSPIGYSFRAPFGPFGLKLKIR